MVKFDHFKTIHMKNDMVTKNGIKYRQLDPEQYGYEAMAFVIFPSYKNRRIKVINAVKFLREQFKAEYVLVQQIDESGELIGPALTWYVALNKYYKPVSMLYTDLVSIKN